MATAKKVAHELGIKTEIIGGHPFVKSKEDYDKVVQYIILKKIDGYHHYINQSS